MRREMILLLLRDTNFNRVNEGKDFKQDDEEGLYLIKMVIINGCVLCKRKITTYSWDSTAARWIFC